MVRGEGTTVARGVTPGEAFDFVLDPAQYTKADTKMIWVTKLADLPNGMITREDGKFLGMLKGSVVTRYSWQRPNHIDVVIEHGVPRKLHAWFEITATETGTRIHHVEELELGHGPLGWVHDVVARDWFARSVRAEVDEIGRLRRTASGVLVGHVDTFTNTACVEGIPSAGTVGHFGGRYGLGQYHGYRHDITHTSSGARFQIRPGSGPESVRISPLRSSDDAASTASTNVVGNA